MDGFGELWEGAASFLCFARGRGWMYSTVPVVVMFGLCAVDGVGYWYGADGRNLSSRPTWYHIIKFPLVKLFLNNRLNKTALQVHDF